MGERAWMGDFFLFGRSRIHDVPGHRSLQALEAALYQRRTHATPLCFIRTRRAQVSIPPYPDNRTAFTFIHASTATYLPLLFSYAFCI